jgi:maleate isomerase
MASEFLGAFGGPPRQRGIGVIAPYDLALDRELWRWTPPEASLHVTRTPFVPVPVTTEQAGLVADEEMVRGVTRDLLVPEPEVVAYACTSGSFVAGAGGERALVEVMLAAGAPAAVTTSGALVDALWALGAGRVAVATPYVVEMTSLLEVFLVEHGVDVVASTGLGLPGEIWKVPYRHVVEMVRAADRPDVEAVFVSCTNLPTYDIIGPLEQELGKPVLTANQVTIWAALRLMGLQAVADGQFLGGLADAPAA